MAREVKLKKRITIRVTDEQYDAVMTMMYDNPDKYRTVNDVIRDMIDKKEFLDKVERNRRGLFLK